MLVEANFLIHLYTYAVLQKRYLKKAAVSFKAYRLPYLVQISKIVLHSFQYNWRGHRCASTFV